MIINGRPYTSENGCVDDELVTARPQEEITVITGWIRQNLIPRKTPLISRSSYGLKHILEHDTGIYITNNAFKDAMMLCGFQPINPNELNWIYCISKRSPAFKNYR